VSSLFDILPYSIRELTLARFKAEISEPDAVPNLDNLQLFAWLCASRSKGRIAEHADVKTLCFNISRFRSFYNKCHQYHICDISTDDIDEVKRVCQPGLSDVS
jgi:hypothetical protein